ncbi:MAG: spermidine synthase [Actinomycetota bacterium]
MAVTRPRSSLFLASFLMLFVELALIRGTTAAVVYLSFFTNLVLLASFLGIGLGFLRARGDRDALRWAPLLLSGLLIFLLVFPVRIGRAVDRVPQLLGIGTMHALPEWLSLSLIFLGVVAVMTVIAERVGRLFAGFAPLDAYRLDVLGSICGIVAFSLLAFVDAGPLVWIVIAGVVALVLLRDELTRFVVLSLAALLALGVLTWLQPRDIWSPYQHVTYAQRDDARVSIRVNNRPHQTMAPLSVLLAEQPFYAYPYDHLPSGPGDVLIVGAGSGNDVALALSKGATHVDAVEIDPVLQRLGRDLHPEHPYQDPRVSVHIDDGRAFLERTHDRYDLILFALPDSLTLVSGQGGLRLESYLFTTEAMETVRDHLRPDGAFSMYNYYRSDVFERYATTLAQVFGHAPCIDRGGLGAITRSQSVLTVGREPGSIICDTPWVERGSAPEPATDDHPFPYLRGRAIPSGYLVALTIVLLASLVTVRVGSGRPLRQMAPYVDLLFMGAAFLLLETKNVVQFALLFGTTWLVNSLVFAGILLAVLGAVEVARHLRLPDRRLLYGLLAASLVVAWFVRPGSLLALDPIPRFTVAIALAFVPVFLANLIFSQRFRDVGASTVAFGANLLGAMLGGVLEYGAIVVGYRNLLILVAVLYALAFVTGRHHLARHRLARRRPEILAAGDVSGVPGATPLGST